MPGGPNCFQRGRPAILEPAGRNLSSAVCCRATQRPVSSESAILREAASVPRLIALTYRRKRTRNETDTLRRAISSSPSA